jgi:hypothetical protein
MIRIVWWDLESRRQGPLSAPQEGAQVVRSPAPPGHDAFAGIDVVIAEAHDIREEGVRQALLQFLEERGSPPLILLTSAQLDNIRALVGLPVDEVSFTSESEREILARALRLATRPERTRIGESFLRSGAFHGCVQRALKKVFLDPDAIPTVEHLARACFVSRRTLEQSWKVSRPESCQATLKILLDWGHLLRARELHRRGSSPPEVAKLLGVHLGTLYRLARRLADCTFSEFSRIGRNELRMLLERGLLGQSGKKSRSA